MPNTRKRIEAIAEIFESEKSYIQDLLVWERDFRMWILDYPLFGLKAKYEMCDKIFINMESIRRLHQEILKDMVASNLEIHSKVSGREEEGNHDNRFIVDKGDSTNVYVQGLEYVSVYKKYIERFGLYNEYAQRLPKAEFELERLMHRHSRFSEGVEGFLDEKNIAFLGIKHFLYRPSQKLARYPLLLKAVFKNEANEDLREEYGRVIERFKAITKSVDKEFNRFSTQFTIYRLGENFRYKDTVKNQPCLALFQKKRRLLKEGEVLIKHHLEMDPNVNKMFVFDHVVLICDFPQDKFSPIYICDEPAFMTRLVVFRKDLGFFPSDLALDRFFPLFLLEAGGSKVRAFYFEDKGERDVYYAIIQKAIRRVKSGLRDDISLEELPFRFTSPVRYACRANKTPWYAESISEESAGEEVSSTLSSETMEDSLSAIETREFTQGHRLLRTMSEFLERKSSIYRGKTSASYGERILGFGESDTTDSEILEEEEMPQRKRSLWEQLFSGTDFFIRNAEFPLPLDKADNPEYIQRQEDMYILAAEDGVYKFLEDVSVKVLDKEVRKIIYDSTYEIMIYQCETTLYASCFSSESTRVEEVTLKNDIGDFFYGVTSQGSYIASKDGANDKSSLIFLFSVAILNERVRIELSRKLYVGFQIYNIFFCSEKIVIACKDFEMVDLDTLRTEELLEVYDPCIPVFFHSLGNTTARCIFAISPHAFLVCFDALGFIIDDVGRVKKTDVIFLWDCRPVDFKIAHKYVICLSYNIMNIFDLKTGVLVFSKCHTGLRFVTGTTEPLLHDGKNFYRIWFGAEEDRESLHEDGLEATPSQGD